MMAWSKKKLICERSVYKIRTLADVGVGFKFEFLFEISRSSKYVVW
jgi:hypothetical protein